MKCKKRGVLARKNEKARLKQIKEMTKRNIFILVEMMTPISDSKAEWKSFNAIWNAEQTKKQINKHQNDDDDVEFIVDTADNPGLDNEGDDEEADFVSFDFENDENDENNVDLNDDHYFN
jgi:hypothetical protein